ncbi:hypothetical protein L228DRAFT_265264 [Xylona heveae TC161]|uniref:Zn(2)-C6 fungal-type domain-containing protein n=1 Tax=Xylona heveae (strain CBS 132557 / TC161) TaxID=1328760 RepID=A0A165K2M7_XYLHT|nr:hypothetical protein L228DRAFT_265264 [Xylona heveae TC161]KZF26915.1 hypothetical protein L228DRAFT_265264 [Xylona heveae TC161]
MTPTSTGPQRTPPCAQCRQRKIRCNKLKPCDNCRKAGLDCSYRENNHASTNTVLVPNSILEDRVAQLEAQLNAVTALLHASNWADPNTPDSSASAASSPAVNKSTDQSSTVLECHCGRQILGTYFSVHYDYYMHWIELFPELRDTFFELSEAEEYADGPKEASQLYLGITLGDFSTLSTYQPADTEADFLIKTFFDNVNPFVRMLNEGAFSSDLTKFRLGRLSQPASFNALLFSMYGLAVTSLHPPDVMRIFGVERNWLLNKFHEAQELALRQVDFINSNKLPVFQAFLFYLVFLFVRGYYRTATSMIGLAARIAQRLGLHKDPSYFTYSSWVAEWRRRLWNQLILLDQKAITLQGAISMLSFAWDTSLPENVNDSAWNTSPLAKPSDAPKETGVFSQMTPILSKRKTLAVLCPLRQNLRTKPYEELISHIETGLQAARELFVDVDDELKPLASFAYIVMEIDFASLRLMAGQAHIRFGQSTSEFRLQNFLGALEILERITSLEAEVTNPGWVWVFCTDPPLLAIAIVLLHLSSVPDTPYAARAWAQINIMFEKYLTIIESNPPPILASLESLRDVARSLHPQASAVSAPLNIGNFNSLDHQILFDNLISTEQRGHESDEIILPVGERFNLGSQSTNFSPE